MTTSIDTLNAEIAATVKGISDLSLWIRDAYSYRGQIGLAADQQNQFSIEIAQMKNQRDELCVRHNELKRALKLAKNASATPAPVIVNLPHGDQYLLPGLAPVESPAVQLSLF